MIGLVFNQLTIIELAGYMPNGSKARMRAVKCRCSCGVEKVLSLDKVKNGLVKSCGCIKRTFQSDHGKHSFKHGMCWTGAYRSWVALKDRCLNSNNSRFKDYGGRGIKVCERWLDFSNFYEDMGDRPEGYSIEREDNDGNYEPRNCKWATAKEQNMNKRNSVSQPA